MTEFATDVEPRTGRVPARICAQGIVKRFPGVLALDGVDLSVHPGEVVALIGENGAGKSTLMKVLAGIERPDSGAVLVDGVAVELESPRAALEHGIALIHQELVLADNLSVGANVFLGREPRRWGFVDHGRIRDDANALLSQLGADFDADTVVARLSLGRQQMVEIAKALSVNARVVIMDEPTSSLTRTECDKLFSLVRDLARSGVAVVYISHRLGEVTALADRAVVLRDGQNAGELGKHELQHDVMVRLMVGREASNLYAREDHPLGDEVLRVRDLEVVGSGGHAVSFGLRAGEIVGIAGLVGSGRTELLEAIFGVRAVRRGEVEVAGEAVRPGDVHAAIRSGLALVPEDRKSLGLFLEMSVSENVALASMFRHHRFGFLDRRGLDVLVDRAVEQLRVKTASTAQWVQTLSGGNQQKVVLGKWLGLEPKVLLLDEPTRGIDVGARQEIYQLLESFAKRGLGILFASSELEEVLGLADRVLVMHEGRLAGELAKHELGEEAVMRLATGAGHGDS